MKILFYVLFCIVLVFSSDIEEYRAPDGTLLRRSEMKNGLQHGITVLYCATGEKESTFTFVKGEATGPFTSYYKNGVVSSRGTYVDGFLDGNFYRYDKRGTLYMSRTHKDKKVHGATIFYNSDGDTTMVLNFKNGVRHGLLLEYSYDGKTLMQKAVFNDGHLAGSPILYRKEVTDPLKTVKSVIEDDGMCQTYTLVDSVWVKGVKVKPSYHSILKCNHY